MLAAVVLVGVGDRLRLPWPALMVVLGIMVAFVPGLPDSFDLDPDLILPLFLPPLLFATAQRTSWALVPGLGISAAIALGAMVAPPDPVAVEAVAGPVHMPRRLLTVLQSEGLFNDATALVVFQAAVLATVQGGTVSAPTLLLRFVLGVIGATAIGLVAAVVARWIMDRVTDTTGRSALTLVLPFAVYLAADEIGASGVVAVVVLALQLRAASGADLPHMLRDAAVICAVVVGVRVLWMFAALSFVRRTDDPERAPRTGREAVVLSWCGMRGLATLALALSLPTATDAGVEFPQRAEIVLIAIAVLVFTLVLPGFTLPVLVRRLGVAADADAESAAEQMIARRARAAATAVLTADDRVDRLPAGVGTNLRQRMDRLDGVLRGDPATAEDREHAEAVRRHRAVVLDVQAEALAAARAEVLAARREPGVDPEAADRVLRRLDLRTVLLD